LVVDDEHLDACHIDRLTKARDAGSEQIDPVSRRYHDRYASSIGILVPSDSLTWHLSLRVRFWNDFRLYAPARQRLVCRSSMFVGQHGWHSSASMATDVGEMLDARASVNDSEE
jgi:hypothetical protein